MFHRPCRGLRWRFFRCVCVGAVAFRFHLAELMGEPKLADFQAALWRDSANGYWWADVAEAGRETEARQAFWQGGGAESADSGFVVAVYQLLFLSQRCEGGAADGGGCAGDDARLRWDHVPLLRQDCGNQAAVLGAIGDDRRSTRAWSEHLIASNNPKAVKLA